MGEWEQNEIYAGYIMNEEPLYRRQELMNQNLARKKFRKVYNPNLAINLYMYLINDAIKQYNNNFPDDKIELTKEDKIEVAKDMIKDFEEGFRLGYYNKLYSKHYQNINKPVEVNSYTKDNGIKVRHYKRRKPS